MIGRGSSGCPTRQWSAIWEPRDNSIVTSLARLSRGCWVHRNGNAKKRDHLCTAHRRAVADW